MAKDKLDELIEESEKALEKGEDLSEIEAEHHHKVKEEPKDKKSSVAKAMEDKEKVKWQEEKKGGDLSPEASAKGEEKQTEEKVEGDKEKPKAKKEKQGKAKIRSKKYQAALAAIDRNKKYELTDALELVKKTSMTKFDGNVEVHMRLLGKSGKPEQVRGLFKYPHATGKKVEVVILDDKIIEEIEKTQKTPADIYLTTPEMMPKVAKLAKILGPKGKMPNPKAGTITANPEKTKEEMAGGQVEYKTDSTGNIHQVIGKVSADNKILEENFQTLLSVLPVDKIVSLTLCATMGPGIKVAIT